LVAAGLFSKADGYFEINAWNEIIGGDASETGSRPRPYDKCYVNCCNPELNAIFGRTNSATYSTLIVVFVSMRFEETRGHCPLLGRWTQGGKGNTTPSEVETHSRIIGTYKERSSLWGPSGTIREVSE